MDKPLDKLAQTAQQQLRQLWKQMFAGAVDAQPAAHRLTDQWPLHQRLGSCA
ncbi:MAG: hypothetical protein AAF622_09510 [Cyanobacteria bacterium P01_C01_bin.147]